MYKKWTQKHEVQWGKHRWEVGRRVVRVSYQTKAPLVRRTPHGASSAGAGLAKPGQLPPLYGALSPVTERVSNVRLPDQANGYRGFGVHHDGDALYERYRSNTNTPNKDYTGPHRATKVPPKDQQF